MSVRSAKGMVCRGGEEKKFIHISVIELQKYSVQLVNVLTDIFMSLALT